MPLPVAGWLLIGLAGVAAAALAATWTKIIRWAFDSFLPWIEQNIPELAPHVRTAFVIVDKVASPVLAAVKSSWWQVRKSLLKQVVDIERTFNGQWVVRVTSWLRLQLDRFGTEPVVKRVVTEQIISHEDLPQEVREQLLLSGTASHQVDVTAIRDRELNLDLET